MDDPAQSGRLVPPGPTATEEVVALEKDYLQLARAHRCDANFSPTANGA
jgi:hypothetical protein